MRTSVACLIAFVMTSPVSVATQESSSGSEPIDVILQYSMIDNVVQGQGAAVMAQLREGLPGHDEETIGELEALVLEEYSVDLLRADVRQFMLDQSLPVILDDLVGWLGTGAQAEIREIEDSYEPPESLQEYAQGLASNPPPEARILLVAEWARVQGAGDFYVLLQEAARQAAQEMARLVDPASPAYTPLTEELYLQQVQQGFQFALVSFLHRFRPASDELIRTAITEYERESGQWYAEAYSFGVAEAIRSAGRRVQARLNEPGLASPVASR